MSGGMCSAQGLRIFGPLFSLDKKMLVLVSWQETFKQCPSLK